MTSTSAVLCSRGLSKVLAETPVLVDVDFEVSAGELVSLIGANGSGKSTFLRALSLLDPPDEGTVDILGTQVEFGVDSELPQVPWPEITLVFQQLFLWPHLTGRQNVELALRGDTRKLDEAQRLYTTFGIADLVDRYPNQLSLGQQQRFALVRGMALMPKVMLLDEVTSALDIRQVRTVLAELQRLKERGTAIVLVSHMIGFAKRAADRVVFLHEGRIAEEGGPEVLVAPQTEALRDLLSLLEAAHG